jgi:hypothetical protein
LEYVSIFYEHFVYFTAIWSILLLFGVFCGHLVYFPHFGMLHKGKSGNPGLHGLLLVAAFAVVHANLSANNEQRRFLNF